MPDIAIIGGGIIGLLTAREFSETGASVVLIDRQTAGREASWAGGGILMPLYPWRQAEAIGVLMSLSLSMYPSLTESLNDATGIDPERIKSGLLVADNPDIEKAVSWCQAHSIRVQQPSPEEIRMLMPNVRVRTNNPLWLPEIAHVRNPRLLQSLKADLKARGVRILEDHEVTGLDQSKGKVVRINTVADAVSADFVILATGAWSGRLWKNLIPELRIEPVKGQMLLFDAKPGLLNQMILSGAQYLIPRRDGKILSGSTVEHTEFDKSTTEDARELLKKFASETLPALRNFKVERHWAGLRPGTPSGIPYIDKHPEIENLSICCGHFRNGLVLGPASARLLADLVLGRPPTMDPAPYAIGAAH
ncbi:MAG: glycine oxidase ThiO [Pseudomonadota bacterium]